MEGSDRKQLVLWFVDQDSIAVFNADSVLHLNSEENVGRSDMLHIQLPELPDNSLKEQRRLLMDLVGREPELHYWDCDEPQLLVIEWSKSTTTLSTSDRKKVDSTFSIRTDKISSVWHASVYCVLGIIWFYFVLLLADQKCSECFFHHHREDISDQ